MLKTDSEIFIKEARHMEKTPGVLCRCSQSSKSQNMLCST